MHGWIRFIPQYVERVWGSARVEDFPHVENEAMFVGKKIGEAWCISDRSEAMSKAQWSTQLYRSFSNLLDIYGHDCMGPRWSSGMKFPLLVKKLYCGERLSLQVHPPQNIAQKFSATSKDEFWFVLKTKPGAQIFAGLKKGVTRTMFEKALQSGDIESCIHVMQSLAGDSLFIPSGRVHAIDKGNLILEIQESSDTTYRVHDWNRKNPSGIMRELHIQKSLQSISFDDYEPYMEHHCDSTMIDCAKFRIQHYHARKHAREISIACNQQPRLLHVVQGCVYDNMHHDIVCKGDSVLLPFCEQFQLILQEGAHILLTENFFLS